MSEAAVWRSRWKVNVLLLTRIDAHEPQLTLAA